MVSFKEQFMPFLSILRTSELQIIKIKNAKSWDLFHPSIIHL